jgi:hypothetical protein
MGPIERRTAMKNNQKCLWNSSVTTMPLGDYKFADRAEHEAAFAWAEQFGPQLGMPAADILPALPYTRDQLVAVAALLSGVKSPYGRFAEIPTARIDPRAPWRTQEVGLAQHVKDHDYLVVRGMGPFLGWFASLLRAPHQSAVTEHLLVAARSGRLIRFDDRNDAARQLQPVVNAGGNLPRKWRWDPPVDIDSDWFPMPEDPNWTGCARVARQGVRCRRWLILDAVDRVYVFRNTTPVGDDNGAPRRFPDPGSAKIYCEAADAGYQSA